GLSADLLKKRSTSKLVEHLAKRIAQTDQCAGVLIRGKVFDLSLGLGDQRLPGFDRRAQSAVGLRRAQKLGDFLETRVQNELGKVFFVRAIAAPEQHQNRQRQFSFS